MEPGISGDPVAWMRKLSPLHFFTSVFDPRIVCALSSENGIKIISPC